MVLSFVRIATPLRNCEMYEKQVCRSGIVGEVNLAENVREPTKELLSNVPLVDLYCRSFEWKCLTHNKTVIRNVNGKSENDVVLHCIRTICTEVTWLMACNNVLCAKSGIHTHTHQNTLPEQQKRRNVIHS